VREKLAACPFGPVHVQFQIHWPATGTGGDASGGAAPDALGSVEELLLGESPAAVCESVHDQIQDGLAVGAASTPVGRTPSDHCQSHTQLSVPEGTRRFDPGRTTATLMSF
jgi:hypothetical protein